MSAPKYDESRALQDYAMRAWQDPASCEADREKARQRLMQGEEKPLSVEGLTYAELSLSCWLDDRIRLLNGITRVGYRDVKPPTGTNFQGPLKAAIMLIEELWDAMAASHAEHGWSPPTMRLSVVGGEYKLRCTAERVARLLAPCAKDVEALLAMDPTPSVQEIDLVRVLRLTPHERRQEQAREQGGAGAKQDAEQTEQATSEPTQEPTDPIGSNTGANGAATVDALEGTTVIPLFTRGS